MKLPVPIRVDAGNFDSEARARSSGGTLRHQVVQQGDSAVTGGISRAPVLGSRWAFFR
jgi:hypothetical protein